jgi:hypothetical protein
MVGIPLQTTLTRVGRATVTRVGRSRLSPCRLARNVGEVVGRRRRREMIGVDWFDGIEPDELAG